MRNTNLIILTLNILFSLESFCQVDSRTENLVGTQAPEWKLNDIFGKLHNNLGLGEKVKTKFIETKKKLVNQIILLVESAWARQNGEPEWA